VTAAGVEAAVAAVGVVAARRDAEWRVRRVERMRRTEQAAAARRTTRRGVTWVLSLALAETRWVLSLAFRASVGLVVIVLVRALLHWLVSGYWLVGWCGVRDDDEAVG
jgi:hypothetical protein